MNALSLTGVIICLCCAASSLSAQEKQGSILGKPTPADFAPSSSPAIDSNTNAIILSDIGSTHFVGNKKGWFSYVFTRQTRIKILNKKAFDLATVKLYLHSRDDDEEKLNDLSASTYNLDNGNLTETKLAKNDVFEEKLNKHTLVEKFTMPSVVGGSIIQYSYSITSDFYFNLPPWEFQSWEAPCLWSEYDVVIPNVLGYVSAKKGIHSFFIDKQKDGKAYYRVEETHENTLLIPAEVLNVSTNTIIHQWVMKDIPRLPVENYLTTPTNYVDKLDFQLSKTNNGETSRDVMSTWTKATDELMKLEDFGAPLKEENEWLDPLLEKIVKSPGDPLQQAREIYYYISGNFTCTDHNDKYIVTTLRDVVKKQSGSVGDLNLLLAAMLRRRHIKADPVLLSTREFGFNPSQYPILDRLNYVICRAEAGGQVYYLDAARPKLAFGSLPENCYNGHARIISEKDSGSVYFWSDSLKEKENILVILSNGVRGGLEGSFQSVSGYPGSYEIREKAGRSGVPGFFKDIQTSYGEDMRISNGGIDSLDNPEVPLTIHYDLQLSANNGEDLIYFNPILSGDYKENPFSAADRKYPVEMPHTLDWTYILNMEIPGGYAVEELPKSARVSFNGNEGSFEYLVANEGGRIQLRSRVKLDRTEFLPQDYNMLRDFFAYIVKKQSEQIVFKKKK